MITPPMADWLITSYGYDFTFAVTNIFPALSKITTILFL